MEHRFHPRAAVQTEVVVFSRGAPVASFLTRDLSLGGTFVRSGPSNLCRNTPLELELALQTGDGGVERHRVSAYVVHSGADGSGLSFLNADSGVRAAIRTAQHLANIDNDPSRAGTADTPPGMLLMGA